ncbi:MAG: hypothetical protein AVDCRST_MAG86-275 [uncultured Truepera sp.]|uniref:Uncharacterized protein n=1 Tax=uncultured Truepera sp. TaxID=543023 RepID=A0A6J4UQI3_9DEIN|nr:MAG: hypothetical protein AVDCRST_MAG86-275 [uncultured Truepera sp.]
MSTRSGVQGVDDALEQLIADIMGAVRNLEYGAVTISVRGGQVVQLERSEKRRLAKTDSQNQKSYAP